MNGAHLIGSSGLKEARVEDEDEEAQTVAEHSPSKPPKSCLQLGGFSFGYTVSVMLIVWPREDSGLEDLVYGWDSILAMAFHHIALVGWAVLGLCYLFEFKPKQSERRAV